MQLKLLLFIVLALVVVIFSVLNPQSVVVNLGFWTAPGIPLAAVIIVSVALGALIMGLLSLPNQVKQALKVRELSRRLEQSTESLQKETERANELDQRLEEILAVESQQATLPEGEVQGGN